VKRDQFSVGRPYLPTEFLDICVSAGFEDLEQIRENLIDYHRQWSDWFKHGYNITLEDVLEVISRYEAGWYERH
jgi:hypothetical protein